MTYQTPITIRKTLEDIQRHDLVLPAIQREFVWGHDQICRFYDSLMQGYPFGTFLYWKVDAENSGKFKWYDFVRDYHEKDRPHCPELPEMHRPLTAVLDGQQRLTALNIGLSGWAAWKLPRLWWDNPNAFPRCLLSFLFPFMQAIDELHVDHVFPRAKVTRRDLQSAGYSDETIETCLEKVNGLANLQLLNGHENREKGGKLPGDWLDHKFRESSDVERQEYANNRLLGDMPGLDGFEEFYEARRESLKKRIRELVAAQ